MKGIGHDSAQSENVGLTSLFYMPFDCGFLSTLLNDKIPQLQHNIHNVDALFAE